LPLYETSQKFQRKELNIWTYYLAPTSAGRKISDVRDRGSPDYWRKWQESFGPSRMDVLWVWKAFGDVINFGSGQLCSYLLSNWRH
jgi:hypothetical protein